MAQFRVEFVVDQATGRYLAELYNPDNQQELMVRTEAIYPSQAAAVLGLVQLFKDAILKFPAPGARPQQKRRRTDRRRTPPYQWGQVHYIVAAGDEAANGILN